MSRVKGRQIVWDACNKLAEQGYKNLRIEQGEKFGLTVYGMREGETQEVCVNVYNPRVAKKTSIEEANSRMAAFRAWCQSNEEYAKPGQYVKKETESTIYTVAFIVILVIALIIKFA